MSVRSFTLTPEIVDQLIKETMPMGYMIWDINGSGLECSPSVVKLFGLQTSQEVFDNWALLSPPIQPEGNSSEFLLNRIFSRVSSGEKIITEWQHQTIEGNPISIEVICMQHTINGKNVCIAYLKPLSSLQKQYEVASEHLRFISILRSCPICFALLADDRFTFVTPFMGNFLGAKNGDSLRDYVPDPDEAEKLCGEVDEYEFVSWVPVKIRTQYGEIKEMLAYSLDFGGMALSEKMIWLVDVTQSRRLENELKAAKELAETSTKAKSEFLANMSHEIRTPMNAIIGLTHLVLRTPLTVQQTEYIETVQQSAHILLRLINDILDFSKIEAGRMLLEYREFSIGSVITGLTAVISMPIQQKNLKFQVEVDKHLPLTVMGDSVRLHQVILNLLTNAVKFTEQGSVRLKIEVAERDMLSLLVRFSVTDSGIGLTPHQIKGLFQPFAQATTATTRQFGGTGLGLAISKQIVDLMYGEISCQSELGEGTTFTFTARFGIPLEGEIITLEDTAEIRTDALLVGDNEHDLAAMQHCIELLGSKAYRLGTDLVPFKNALDTRRLAEIDFIIFDVNDFRHKFALYYQMLCERCNSHGEQMPVCVVTEHPERKAVLDGLNISDTALILKKPVIASDLFSIVTQVSEIKKELLRQKKIQEHQESFRNGQDVYIPDAIRGARILLAEDNKINQMVATELLKIEGFETTVAENGFAVLEVLKKQQFDLILMDVQMPEMDGFETTRAIRSDPQYSNLPILAMTANAMSGDRALSLEAGMDDHIAKPIEPKVLYSALVKWIQK